MVPGEEQGVGGREEKVLWLWGTPSAMKKGAHVEC